MVSLLVGLATVGLLLALWPPAQAVRWRRWTRPLRRLVRPWHYRYASRFRVVELPRDPVAQAEGEGGHDGGADAGDEEATTEALASRPLRPYGP